MVNAQIGVVEILARHLVGVLFYQDHSLLKKQLRIEILFFCVLSQNFLVL